MKVIILRIGHRFERDKRVTSHLGLVGRAFGADGLILGDLQDMGVEETIRKIIEKFGGEFSIEMGKRSLDVIRTWKKDGGEVIHLTMYGLSLPKIIQKIRSSDRDKLIVVGASKVPRAIYNLATYNVAVTNQPHSEIAALAVFLDYLFEGKEFEKAFPNAKLKIIPSRKDKVVQQMK
ncbi:MAG: tRNA (cytidine(56)-2'-O)-methyltransferase [Candidatus Helarchaeota archaeon]